MDVEFRDLSVEVFEEGSNSIKNRECKSLIDSKLQPLVGVTGGFFINARIQICSLYVIEVKNKFLSITTGSRGIGMLKNVLFRFLFKIYRKYAGSLENMLMAYLIFGLILILKGNLITNEGRY